MTIFRRIVIDTIDECELKGFWKALLIIVSPFVFMIGSIIGACKGILYKISQ